MVLIHNQAFELFYPKLTKGNYEELSFYMACHIELCTGFVIGAKISIDRFNRPFCCCSVSAL
jgi:hypothetical protein